MRHRFKDLNRGMVCTGFAKVWWGFVCLVCLWGSVYGGEDPYQYLQDLPSNYTVDEWIADPA